MIISQFDTNLTPIQRLTLFHDGSMTKFLELLYAETVQTKILKESSEFYDDYLQDWKQYIPNAQIQREVILSNSKGPLIYARSLWTQSNYDLIMKDKQNIAIGKNLEQKQVSQRRQILIGCKSKLPKSSQLEQKEVLCRAYLIYQSDNLLMYLEEYMLF